MWGFGIHTNMSSRDTVLRTRQAPAGNGARCHGRKYAGEPARAVTGGGESCDTSEPKWGLGSHSPTTNRTTYL